MDLKFFEMDGYFDLLRYIEAHKSKTINIFPDKKHIVIVNETDSLPIWYSRKLNIESEDHFRSLLENNNLRVKLNGYSNKNWLFYQDTRYMLILTSEGVEEEKINILVSNKIEIKIIREDIKNIKSEERERESYGEYAGSYAQYVEDLSDDFINEVLDGDPDAYWNID